MFSFIVKVFKSLNSNSHPGEIAHGVSIALILGFLPKNNALWYLLFVFFIFVNINKGALLLFILIFSSIANIFDPLFDKLGYAILMLEPLKSSFNSLLNIPFVAFTKFNNTIVMGSLIAALILYIPVYVLTRFLIKLWRLSAAPLISQSKLVKALYNIPLVQKIAGIAASQELF